MPTQVGRELTKILVAGTVPPASHDLRLPQPGGFHDAENDQPVKQRISRLLLDLPQKIVRRAFELPGLRPSLLGQPVFQPPPLRPAFLIQGRVLHTPDTELIFSLSLLAQSQQQRPTQPLVGAVFSPANDLAQFRLRFRRHAAVL